MERASIKRGVLGLLPPEMVAGGGRSGAGPDSGASMRSSAMVYERATEYMGLEANQAELASISWTGI